MFIGRRRSKSSSTNSGFQKKKTSNRSVIKFRKCRLCDSHIKYIDFLNTKLLSEFQSESGKILSRKLTGICNFHQKMLANAIKRARIIGLVL